MVESSNSSIEWENRNEKQNSALCRTINVNPERSSERRSFVQPPRINPNSRLPPCVLHSNSHPSSLLNGGIIHCTRNVVSFQLLRRASPRLAFSKLFRNLGPSILHIRIRRLARAKGRKSAAWLLNGRPLDRVLEGTIERVFERKKGEKRESLAREEGSFFFLFTTKLTLVQFSFFFFLRKQGRMGRSFVRDS